MFYSIIRESVEKSLQKYITYFTQISNLSVVDLPTRRKRKKRKLITHFFLLLHIIAIIKIDPLFLFYDKKITYTKIGSGHVKFKATKDVGNQTGTYAQIMRLTLNGLKED